MRIAGITIVALGVALLPSPARADFTRVNFEYTSLAHLGFAGSTLQVPFDAATTVDMLGDFLRSGGANVGSVGEALVKQYQTPSDKVCEAWTHAVYRAEWASYDRNKFRDYKKIDRKQPTECLPAKAHWLQYGFSVETFTADAGAGYRIVASVDRSVSHTANVMRPSFSAIFGERATANMWTMVPSSITTTIPFETALIVHVWRKKEDSRTSIFVIGVPKSGAIEAAPGAGIGYPLRGLADGKIEASAVQNLLSYMSQKSIKHEADSTKVAPIAASSRPDLFNQP